MGCDIITANKKLNVLGNAYWDFVYSQGKALLETIKSASSPTKACRKK